MTHICDLLPAVLAEQVKVRRYVGCVAQQSANAHRRIVQQLLLACQGTGSGRDNGVTQGVWCSWLNCKALQHLHALLPYGAALTMRRTLGLMLI